MGGRHHMLLKLTADLQVPGGSLRHVGEDAATSAAMDLANLTWLYPYFRNVLIDARKLNLS